MIWGRGTRAEYSANAQVGLDNEIEAAVSVFCREMQNCICPKVSEWINGVGLR